jgi:hypothetical protein
MMRSLMLGGYTTRLSGKQTTDANAVKRVSAVGRLAPSCDGRRGSSCLPVAKLREELFVVLPDLGDGGHDRLCAVQGGRG